MQHCSAKAFESNFSRVCSMGTTGSRPFPFSQMVKRGSAPEGVHSICAANGLVQGPISSRCLFSVAGLPWGSLAKGSSFWWKTVLCKGISQYMHMRTPRIRPD